jgi:hypothetical protein
MTSGERTVMIALVDAWNAFILLDVEHPDDTDCFRHIIHDAQAQIMKRPTRRRLWNETAMPDSTGL